jgi:hypothetical protein
MSGALNKIQQQILDSSDTRRRFYQQGIERETRVLQYA